MAQRSFVIGICGGTGSGKTTITDRLSRALLDDGVVVLQQDHYYKDLSHLSSAERARCNFDHPNALDTPLFVEHIRDLREGRAIERPVYDFTQHRRVSETVRIESRPAILVEGILIFENEQLRSLMDVKIFVDTDADLRFIRRLARDIRERGRTVDSVIEQYQQTVRPMHLEFVEPSKRYADIIIPEGGHNEAGIDLIIQKVRSLLSQ
ncbi:MAG: uridine kinase [Candidatus Acidiferrales bacterium]